MLNGEKTLNEQLQDFGSFFSPWSSNL